MIDVGDGPIVLVNPEVLETSGSQTGEEGCLSLPGKSGQVTRPNYAKVHAFNENMEEYEVEGEELLARALYMRSTIWTDTCTPSLPKRCSRPEELEELLKEQEDAAEDEDAEV